MKNSWRIYKNDLKNIGTNWVAAILIGGLILLPSLYAWFNIKASWDPYSQTDQIPIGIVNEDQGTVVRDQEIHVGDELVETLHQNRSMDWQFIKREKAMDKLEYGDYFAVIVIPENFSERLGTVISDHPEKAEVEYYVNEKINAIAPKITEKGASVIVQQISSNFISTVNGIIFDLFNDLGIELEENLPDIKKFEHYIFTVEENLPEIHTILNDTISDANRAEDLINQAQGLVPRVEDATTNGINTIDNTIEFIDKADTRLDEIAPRIEEDLDNIQKMVSDVNEYVSSIESASLDLSEGNQLTDQVNGRIDDTLTSIETVEQALSQFQVNQNEQPRNNQDAEKEQVSNGDYDNISNALSELERMESSLRALQDQANQIDTFLGEQQTEANQLLSTIKERTASANTQVDAFVKEYNENIEPTVRKEVGNAKDTLKEARGILVDIQSAIPEVETLLNQTEGKLINGEDMLEKVLAQFPYINDKVNELADRIRNIQGETNIDEIIQLLQNDPEAERGFFAEPVVLNENKLFPIANYGTGMTPFYTVLAIWVGGLLLISLLSTELHHGKEVYTGRQIYLGRLLTFMTIGFLQTLIVTLGDIFLLNVDVKAPLWFVLFGLLCSSVFIWIVYTFVSVFGDVGKALAIVLLVLQIAGSGGTYPVALLPEFFQNINPFLPFTYAIDLMREAVGGIVWRRVWNDVLFLVVLGLGVLLIGFIFKEKINQYTGKLKEKSRESGLFH